MQLYGGSVSSSVRNQLGRLYRGTLDAKTAARWLSVFDCEMDLPHPELEDSLCAVLDNILSRGTPTICSPYVEQILAKQLQLSRARTSSGGIEFDFSEALNDEVNYLLRRALVIIDPRLEPAEILANRCDSEKEREFLHSILPEIVGAHVCQLAETQRPLDSIAKVDKFKDQRADFAFEFSGKTSDDRGLIIEIDGAQHDEAHQARLDKQRDAAVRAAGWQTIRIKTSELSSIPSEKVSQLKTLFQNELVQTASENYQKPFWRNERARRVFQLVLVPLAVARIQKTLVQLIRADVLSLDASQWKIAVHERDVPCAWLAIADFLQLLSNLCALQGQAFRPKVELRVYCSEEFAGAELGKPVFHLSFDYRREVAGFHGKLSDDLAAFDADVLLDIAVLQRAGLTTVEPALKDHIAPNAVTAVIRSVHHIDAIRRVAVAEPITYQHSKGKKESLRYFLRYLFRKEEFWEGQVDILERALARETVIGLLPTGAGKSLCYQLSALLQPGITLVVDPLKSLMHDQDDHLREAGIDTTTFIDSSLKGDQKAERIAHFQEGQFQFVFISPERLLIREFRNALTEMTTGASPKWFAYCVVDEAHCVSEWGHDFRTAYLRLGENARRFCKPASGSLPFIALTGTASFDVLSDVQRELQIGDEKAIVTPKSYQRDELQFEIHTVAKPKSEDKEVVAEQKKQFLVDWLKRLPNKFGARSDENGDFFKLNRERTNSGLVFCPHVGRVFGIKEVAAHIQQNTPQLAKTTGIFGSKLEKDGAYSSGDLEEIQRKFKNNELALLVATKSFGMGIDKPNIRYTVHFTMPPSIEAFYQEAGRAGRDRQQAVCALLFSEGIDKDLMIYFHRDSFLGEKREKPILYRLLTRIESARGFRPGIEKALELMAVGESQAISIGFTGTRSRRSKQETFRAVYRLSVVGAIEDYTVDYKARLIEAIVRKRSEDEYIKTLTTYVSRYMSYEEAKRVPDEIRQRKGETVLQKCLGYLIEFVYNRIAKRRKEAMDVMEQAAKVGAYPNQGTLDKSEAECRKDFADFVNSYFDSRYTPELRGYLYDYDLDLVWRYIDKVQGEPDPAKHLLGSCNRLLTENPNHAALLMLRAYARLVLGYSQEDVIEDFERGLKSFEDAADRSTLIRAISRFYGEVERQNTSALPVIAGAISRRHLNWLKEFNQRFGGGESHG